MKGRTYRYFDDPLFAFGYGKSYTTFKVGEAQIINVDSLELRTESDDSLELRTESLEFPTGLQTGSKPNADSRAVANSKLYTLNSPLTPDSQLIPADAPTRSLSPLTSQLTIPVTNTGQRDGTETVQLYIRNTADKEGPLKSLRGFQRVSVKAGQTAVATLTLTPKSFEFWDPETNTMRTKPGTYELLYGNSSQDKDLKVLTVTL